jgi:ABC-type transport system involved in multi-copper enzyme maturation permease subunit
MRLIRAELLKLRKRRGLVAATALVTIAPMAIAYTVLSILHASNPEKHDPAGGIDNFTASVEVMTQIGVVAAILIGATAGAGDRGAGVFRELVVTGRSRLALFAARVPGGLALLLPFVAAAFAISAVAAVTLTGDGQSPVGAATIAQTAAWVGLAMVTAYALALGVSSAFGSRGTAIAILLGWQLAAAPILLATGRLDDVLPNAALVALEPAEEAQLVTTSVPTAIAILVLWTFVPLAAGAWRTRTADA